MYSYYGKAEFLGAITPGFSVTWSFRNNSNMQNISIENSCVWCAFVETEIKTKQQNKYFFI